MSHDMENPKIARSPHLGEIKRMHKQCVPGASPFFARAGGQGYVELPYLYFQKKKAGRLPGNEATSLIPFCCLYFVIFTFVKNASIGH